jgi:hypothetical protein
LKFVLSSLDPPAKNPRRRLLGCRGGVRRSLPDLHLEYAAWTVGQGKRIFRREQLRSSCRLAKCISNICQGLADWAVTGIDGQRLFKRGCRALRRGFPRFPGLIHAVGRLGSVHPRSGLHGGWGCNRGSDGINKLFCRLKGRGGRSDAACNSRVRLR